jgi:hypothetical protein
MNTIVENVRNKIQAISVPDITSSAMLVDLNISGKNFRKRDKNSADELAVSKHASTSSFNLTKSLMNHAVELGDLTKHIAHTRNMHYRMTLPWSDNGSRLLTVKKYPEYVEAMTGRQAEMFELLEKFLGKYDSYVVQAVGVMGDLYDVNDFPDVEEVKQGFSFNFRFIPLATSNDFRVDIANETKNVLAESYEKYFEEQYNNSMNSLWGKLATALAKVSERLDYDEGKGEEKKMFHDTLVSNVEDVLEMFDAYNVNKDPVMAEVSKKLNNIFSSIDADALRTSQTVRKHVKGNVDDVLKTIGLDAGW